MKIVSWNVNGIRAALGKNALDQVWELKPDLFCLQEVKARPEQLTEDQRAALPMKFVWNPAERPGYSGVTTFHKEEPKKIILGLGESKYDIEGRVIQTLHPDFRLFNIYFPNGQRGNERLDYKLDFYAYLLKLCDAFHKNGEKIIITGDFNTAHMPIDLKNPKANEKTSGFMPQEREWVQKFLDHGFIDAFRHLYPDKVQYTWWTYRLNARKRGIGWRLDYFLVSESLMPRVKDVIVHDGILGSDHCPVELSLD